MGAHHDLEMCSSPAGSPKELVPLVQRFCVNVKVTKINHVIIQTCGLVGVKKKGLQCEGSWEQWSQHSQ